MKSVRRCGRDAPGKKELPATHGETVIIAVRADR
jgi:hypothetical protein